MQVDPAQLEAIFGEALTKPDAAACAAYLDQACGGNAELRKRVETLLAAHDVAGDFLKLPGGDPTSDHAIHLSETPGAKIGRYLYD